MIGVVQRRRSSHLKTMGPLQFKPSSDSSNTFGDGDMSVDNGDKSDGDGTWRWLTGITQWWDEDERRGKLCSEAKGLL